jgi:nucleoside-diphosphate-sugar epimerase
MKIFIAGATGAIGLPLVRVLCALGHEVTGMTRAGTGVDRLREAGALVSRADAFDARAVREAIGVASPEIVINQLTRLPADPAKIVESLPENSRLLREGGRNLLAAAEALGVKRYIMQSRGFFLDAPAGQLADESAKLRYRAPEPIGEEARAVGEHEDEVLASASLEGVALRYGVFYGPGTWYRPGGAIAEQLKGRKTAIIGEGKGVWSFVHIDDAVAATVAALTSAPGVYNVVDDEPLPVAEWLPAFARWVDAPPPLRANVEDVLKSAGEVAVYYHASLTGASNLKAKEKLGFRPRPLLYAGHSAS